MGRWASEPTQQQGLEILANEHGVHWSCTALRHVLGSLRTGMAPHRHGCQVEQVVRWIEQARTAQGRFRPPLSVGRDGIFVPLRHGVWQEGATGTISVLDRRGKRLGTVSLGHRPEPGQGTRTDQLSALLRALLRRGDSPGRRVVSGTAEGYHPSDDSPRVLKKMTDPHRPWRRLEGRRSIDFSHACPYRQKLADAIFGGGAAAQRGAKQMRHVLKTQAAGVSRVVQSAAALRRGRGLCGQAKAYDQA